MEHVQSEDEMLALALQLSLADRVSQGGCGAATAASQWPCTACTTLNSLSRSVRD